MNVTQKNQQALTKRFGRSVVVLFGVLSVCFVVNTGVTLQCMYLTGMKVSLFPRVENNVLGSVSNWWF